MFKAYHEVVLFRRQRSRRDHQTVVRIGWSGIRGHQVHPRDMERIQSQGQLVFPILAHARISIRIYVKA